ncbi:PREDICTED: defensin-like protein 107 [Camelina sativa]|uniref:Defensin-like protein 107 n=1 Tax=Camelina sativa TaxID=90675 RepID=A0ABM1RSX3_CAMSA|nr:PREDICTED: defensin-like protein 107 [Camelina sativa]
MAISKKKLISFVFTVLFIISSVNCRMKTSYPGYGIKQQDRQCFKSYEYLCRGGEGDCKDYCRDHDYATGLCVSHPDACCCTI